MSLNIQDPAKSKVNSILNCNSSIENRATFINSLYEKAVQKVNHLDNLKRTNLTISLLIFSGLSGFILSNQDSFLCILTSVLLLSINIFTYFSEKKLSSYHIGWQEASIKLAESYLQLLNNPDRDISIVRYDKNAERAYRFVRSDKARIFIFFNIVSIFLLLLSINNNFLLC